MMMQCNKACSPMLHKVKGKHSPRSRCNTPPGMHIKIGVKFWKQIGGKSWKQEDAESTTTTLSKAGCCGKDLVLQADDREVVLIPLTIAMDGLPSLQVPVNLSHTYFALRYISVRLLTTIYLFVATRVFIGKLIPKAQYYLFILPKAHSFGTKAHSSVFLTLAFGAFPTAHH